MRILSGRDLPPADPDARRPDPKRRERIREALEEYEATHDIGMGGQYAVLASKGPRSPGKEWGRGIPRPQGPEAGTDGP